MAIFFVFSGLVLAHSPLKQRADYDAIVTYIQVYHPKISTADMNVIAQEIVSQSAKYHLDPKLIAAVISVESGFKKTAINRSGASGLGQLMPGTWRRLNISNPFDIAQNVSATTRYLYKLYQCWDGDKNQTYLTLASYLRGEGTIKKRKSNLRTSTLDYVANILKKYQKMTTIFEEVAQLPDTTEVIE